MRQSFSLLMVTLVAFSGGSALAATQLTGAGATFPYPLYSKWISDFQKDHPDTQINYQSIGSGGGIAQFTKKTVDFGATDSPMTNEQIAKVEGPVVHVPTALGAVVLATNLPGVTARLKLTGEVVADLFLGKITQWNDARIVALNPGTAMPNQPVMIVHRSDGSGTSAVFTDYLAKVSPDWKSKVGAGTAVNWPVGLGGKGNEGVAGLIKQTPGAMGYVELIYATNNQMPVALLRNRAGNYVDPSPRTVTAAAAANANSIPADFRVSITDSAGKDAYPISSFTYLLVGKSLKLGADKGKALLSFLNWALTDGQKTAEGLSYAPLPAELAKKVRAAVKGIAL